LESRGTIPRLKEYTVKTSHWLWVHFKSFAREIPPTLQLMGTVIKWGGVPEQWQLDFVTKMKELEKTGVSFSKFLRIALPQLFGEESEVLHTWIGRKASRSPKKFVKSVRKMWGPSAHSVVVSLNRIADEKNLFERKVDEPAYKGMLEAIKKADDEAELKAIQVVQPETPEESNLAMINTELLRLPVVKRDSPQTDEQENH